MQNCRSWCRVRGSDTHLSKTEPVGNNVSFVIDSGIHHSVPDKEEEKCTDSHVHEVLEHDVHGVLG